MAQNRPYGMQHPRARQAMLWLIIALTFILALTIAKPELIRSFDFPAEPFPAQTIRNHPTLFYLLDLIYIALAFYIGFLKKNR